MKNETKVFSRNVMNARGIKMKDERLKIKDER